MSQIEHRERKQAIRSFMRAHYTDERLAELLAHAQDGKLAYISCCCFIGIVTASHPLRQISSEIGWHYQDAKRIPGAPEAEHAFYTLAEPLSRNHKANEQRRRRILIPMIRAEMKRRALAVDLADGLTALVAPALGRGVIAGVSVEDSIEEARRTR